MLSLLLKAMEKINNHLFTGIVRLCIAAVLISGFFTINMMNLFCSDGLYPIGAEISVTPASVLMGAVVLIAVILLIFAVFRFTNKLKYATITIVAIAFILRIIFVFLWKIEPESDFEITFELSRLLHNTPLLQWGAALDNYGTIYNNQWSAHIPFIIYQAIFPNKLTIQIVNSVFSVLTCVFTAGIVKELFGKKTADIVLLLSAINPLTLFYITVLTNQHAASCFFIAALWCFYRKPIKKPWLNGALCGMLTAVSQLLRPEMYVVLIAAAVVCIYYIFQNGEAVKSLTIMIVYIAVFFAVLFSVNAVLEKSGVIHQSILEGNLKYKITVGLNKETNGAWSAEDEQLIYNEDALNEEFIQRVKSPSLKMMYGKISYQFGTYVYPWAMSQEHPNISQIIYRRGSAAFMSVTVILAVLALLFVREKRLFAIYVILAGYMAVFAIIEIQARYNYLTVPLILILASGMIKNSFYYINRQTKPL